MARTGCSRREAARRVRRSKPELAIGKAITEPPERFEDEMAKTKWLRAVDETRIKWACSSTEALQRTRREQPDLWKAYQGLGGDFENPQPWSGQRK